MSGVVYLLYDATGISNLCDDIATFLLYEKRDTKCLQSMSFIEFKTRLRHALNMRSSDQVRMCVCIAPDVVLSFVCSDGCASVFGRVNGALEMTITDLELNENKEQEHHERHVRLRSV